MEFLTHVMRQETKSTTTLYDNKNTLSVLEQEKVAKWHFNKMDENKDQVIRIGGFHILRQHLRGEGGGREMLTFADRGGGGIAKY